MNASAIVSGGSLEGCNGVACVAFSMSTRLPAHATAALHLRALLRSRHHCILFTCRIMTQRKYYSHLSAAHAHAPRHAGAHVHPLDGRSVCSSVGGRRAGRAIRSARPGLGVGRLGAGLGHTAVPYLPTPLRAGGAEAGEWAPARGVGGVTVVNATMMAARTLCSPGGCAACLAAHRTRGTCRAIPRRPSRNGAISRRACAGDPAPRSLQ
jgi:hypothetical protein